LGQTEVLRFLKKNGGWCTVKTIVHHLNIRQTTINKNVKQLHKHGLVIIVIDGKRHLIKIREETLKEE